MASARLAGLKGSYIELEIHLLEFELRGDAIRAEAKKLVLDYMRSTSDCKRGGLGMRLSPIFKACGFDWGDQEKATSSNQQYWIVALMRQLEAEGVVEQVSPSGPWRLL